MRGRRREPPNCCAPGRGTAWCTRRRLVAVLALAQGREPRRGPATVAGWSFATGIVLFSGSLFALAAGAAAWVGWLAPIGGAALMLGWAALAVLSLRRR
ncbi:MAG: DUF423 domain-containing protein [Alphaproteobacteria bacterium]